MSRIDILGIKQDTPHRYPFLLVDRVLDFKAGESILALKNVTCNEEFFNGHFPERPVMPGVLLIEALAQASGLLIFYTTNARANADDNWYFLAGVDKARFKRIVNPGDQIMLSSTILKQRRELWVFSAKASVDGEVVCSAELLIAKGALQ